MEAPLLSRHDLSPSGQMVKLSPHRCPPGQTSPFSGYRGFHPGSKIQKPFNPDHANSSLLEITPLIRVPWDEAPLKAFLYDAFCVPKRFGWLFLRLTLKDQGVILQHLPLDRGVGHHCELPAPCLYLLIDTNSGSLASLERGPCNSSRVTKDSQLDPILLRVPWNSS